VEYSQVNFQFLMLTEAQQLNIDFYQKFFAGKSKTQKQFQSKLKLKPNKFSSQYTESLKKKRYQSEKALMQCPKHK
jgi:hypothetical protein